MQIRGSISIHSNVRIGAALLDAIGAEMLLLDAIGAEMLDPSNSIASCDWRGIARSRGLKLASKQISSEDIGIDAHCCDADETRMTTTVIDRMVRSSEHRMQRYPCLERDYQLT